MKWTTHGKHSSVNLLTFFKTWASLCLFTMLGCLALPGTLAANTGGAEQVNVSAFSEIVNAYVGVYEISGKTAENAAVVIDSNFTGMVFGGYSLNGEANYNLLSLTGGSVTSTLSAGYSASENVEGNTLQIQGGTMQGNIYGGVTIGSGNAVNNRVIMTGGELQFSAPPKDIVGGRSVSGLATENYVHISGGNIEGNISGGSSDSGVVTDNTVLLTGGEISGAVYGGRSLDGNVTGNSVEINGTTYIDNNDVFGGRSNAGNASYNGVQVYNGTIKENIYGGSSLSGDAIGNTITIHQGEFGKGIYGGYALNANASENNLIIYGGRIVGNVYGGFGKNTDRNTVTLSGGEFKEDIYGGYADTVSGGGGTYNVLNIYGAPIFSKANAVLYGAGSSGGLTGDIYTGNTLNIYTKGIQAGSLKNFQNYSFILFNAPEPALLLTDAHAFNSTDTLSISYATPGIEHAVGKPIVLLKSMGGLTLNGLALNPGTLRQGFTLEYSYTLAQDADSLVATISNPQILPESKALLAGRNGGFAALNMAADLVAGAGIENAMAAGFYGNSDYSFAPFYAMSALGERYATGKRIDVKNYALLFGFAKKWELQSADIVMGAFMEGSTGSYISKDTFQTHAPVTGEGDLDSFGAGVLGRVALQSSGLQGLYVEGSFRFGALNSSYSTNDIQDAVGNSPSYTLRVPYYGAHAGIGWHLKITPLTSLDVYGKYLWSRQNAASTLLQADPVKFSALNSQRMRLGFRFAYAINENIRPYLGAAWEYEFAGKQRATSYGYAIAPTSLKGSSALAELGVSVRPSATLPVTFDLGVQGHWGKRQGISGTMQIKFVFGSARK